MLRKKKIATLALVLVFNIACSAQKKACPINFTKESLEYVKRNQTALDGKIVALSCALLRREKSYQDKPYLLVAVDGYKDETIWIASTMKIDFNIENKNLRIMGYFSNLRQDDTISRKYNTDGYHVIALAIVNTDDKKMDMLPAAKAMAQEWIDGKIPEAVKR